MPRPGGLLCTCDHVVWRRAGIARTGTCSVSANLSIEQQNKEYHMTLLGVADRSLLFGRTWSRNVLVKGRAIVANNLKDRPRQLAPMMWKNADSPRRNVTSIDDFPLTAISLGVLHVRIVLDIDYPDEARHRRCLHASRFEVKGGPLRCSLCMRCAMRDIQLSHCLETCVEIQTLSRRCLGSMALCWPRQRSRN